MCSYNYLIINVKIRIIIINVDQHNRTKCSIKEEIITPNEEILNVSTKKWIEKASEINSILNSVIHMASWTRVENGSMKEILRI